MSDKVYDYIIIGSGFGGSVSAMRLSEKGYNCLVIEKGKRFGARDFPKTNWNLKKFFWAPAMRMFGIMKLTFFKEVFVMSGVGVGGGSLVYANTHLVPPDRFFEHPRWAHLNENWKDTLMPFYDKAKFMLGTVRNTVYGTADEVLKSVAEDMGRLDSYKPVDVGVYFGDADKETDPYFKGLGPNRTGCQLCAGCMVGCQHGAKNTLDKNYLYFAEEWGTDVLPETLATQIEYKDGQYLVHTKSSTGFLGGKKHTYKSTGLVVSGGVLGTMDILLKQKYDHKTMTNLSDQLGENLRTNSESICGVSAPKQKLNHGIAISSVFDADDHTHVEVVKYPDGSDAMRGLATMSADGEQPILRFVRWTWNMVKNPVKTLKFLFGGNWARRSVILLVMQTLDNSMKMTLKKFPWSRIGIENDTANKVPAYIPKGQEVLHRYADKVDGIAQNALTEITFNMATTAHILGGCPMGATTEEGVVNERFEAHGYPNMYILDGSIMPCNPGVNPSLTITALSEYAMSLVKDKEGNQRASLTEQMAASNA